MPRIIITAPTLLFVKLVGNAESSPSGGGTQADDERNSLTTSTVASALAYTSSSSSTSASNNNYNNNTGGVLEQTIRTIYHTTRSSILLRSCIALLILWYVLSSLPKGRKYRQLSALLTSAVGCFVTVAYLSPIFTTYSTHSLHHHHQLYYDSSASGRGGGGGRDDESSNIGLVHASLLLLAFNAIAVGAALGSLLPRAASGATLGYSITILIEALLFGFAGIDGGPSDSSMTTKGGIAFYYQFVGPTVAIVGGVITARYVHYVLCRRDDMHNMFPNHCCCQYCLF